MDIQEAKDKAAQQQGYKDWAHAIHLMNENGISALTDSALTIISAHSHEVGFGKGYAACSKDFGKDLGFM